MLEIAFGDDAVDGGGDDDERGGDGELGATGSGEHHRTPRARFVILAVFSHG